MYGPLFASEYLLSKFAESVTVSRPITGEILYYSNKLTEANGTVSVTMGEIRGGVGNPIIGVIPSDGNASVEITDQTLSLAMRAYQTGGLHGYGAPTLVCADIVAAEGTLTIDPAVNGTPVAGQGFGEAFAYVQKIGAKATITGDGIPYAIDANNALTGVTVTNGDTYKVWYWVNAAGTEFATILADIDPSVVNVRLVYPVYSNVKEDGTGSRIGSLVVVYPFLKLNANAGVNGNNSSNVTTSVSGMAISYEDATVQAGCGSCSETSGALVHYLYVACDGGADKIEGLVYVGGSVSLPKSSSKQLQFYLVVNGNLVKPDPAYMSYAMSTSISGTSVSSSGLLTSGTTAGDGEATGTYTNGTTSFACPVNVTVTNS